MAESSSQGSSTLEDASSPPSAPSPPASSSATGSLKDIAAPWLDYTVVQAEELRRSVALSTDTALQSARSHLVDLQSASSQQFHSAQDLFKSAQSEYGYYEELFFQKIKDGLHIAGENPAASYLAIAGFALLALKRPRRFLFRHTIGRFQSDEVLLSSSEKKVNEMQQIVDQLKNESKKLEERASLAENELLRGKTKLKQVGGQLQTLVTSIYKSEAQAKGLMENLRELPGRDALKFRAEVASMAADAKKQRVALSKKVTKIANYGIPV